VVFASSAAVYGNPSEIPTKEDAPKAPLSPYGEAKLASEHLLFVEAEKHGFTARRQRYFNVTAIAKTHDRHISELFPSSWII
jgi:UDP-glucose 4-epimerase